MPRKNFTEAQSRDQILTALAKALQTDNLRTAERQIVRLVDRHKSDPAIAEPVKVALTYMAHCLDKDRACDIAFSVMEKTDAYSGLSIAVEQIACWLTTQEVIPQQRKLPINPDVFVQQFSPRQLHISQPVY